jgi:hypothetical protein
MPDNDPLVLSVRAQQLRNEIHATENEQPYKSGQLAVLTGRTREQCPWVEDSPQFNAFRAGYTAELDLLARERAGIERGA